MWITRRRFDFQNRWNIDELSTWFFSMLFSPRIDVTSEVATWRNTGSDFICVELIIISSNLF